jgi:hypothetical protein
MPPSSTLTDEQLATIAWADPGESVSALAMRIGATYDAVSRTRRSITAAGGWWCRVGRGTCTECGGLLLFNAETVPRTVHRGCERARIARYRLTYRAEGRPHARATSYVLSTPRVRAWRQRSPARYAEHLQRRYQRLRDRWPSLPAEIRAASLEGLRERQRQDQALTWSRADRAGQRWGADEDEVVLDRNTEPARELALELGRTVYAIQHRRFLLRQRANSLTDA